MKKTAGRLLINKQNREYIKMYVVQTAYGSIDQSLFSINQVKRSVDGNGNSNYIDMNQSSQKLIHGDLYEIYHQLP
ncbi:hypothetical protein [Jeotgalibacillus marinus]|uniref:Uncharacterized protein n=1 Tax=Jeotgalibacillus marinus TaxID=86667 RepID=A0ABV3Q0S2_9BACL